MNDQDKRENVINKVKAIVADMQEEVDEWKDYSDSELRGGLTCDCDWWYKTLQTLKDTLALLKAQEPVVHAKWQGVTPFVDTKECSNCRYNIQSEELETPYCPWCGAKMDDEVR